MSGAIHHEDFVRHKAALPYVRICKKCGGSSERVATLPERIGNTAYEVFQCVDCESLEWLAERRGDCGLMQKCGGEE